MRKSVGKAIIGTQHHYDFIPDTVKMVTGNSFSHPYTETQFRCKYVMMGDEGAHADGFYVFWPFFINVDRPWFFATTSFPTLTQIFPRLKQNKNIQCIQCLDLHTG